MSQFGPDPGTGAGPNVFVFSARSDRASRGVAVFSHPTVPIGRAPERSSRSRRGRPAADASPSSEGPVVQPIPVVLIHGAWLHASSWEAWAERFARHGYTVDAPGWPGEEPTLEAARRDPGPLRDLRIGQLLEHYERIARSCDTPAILVGHALGGLIAQRLLGAGIGQAAVAIASQPPAGLVEPGVPNRPHRPGPAGAVPHHVAAGVGIDAGLFVDQLVVRGADELVDTLPRLPVAGEHADGEQLGGQPGHVLGLRPAAVAQRLDRGYDLPLGGAHIAVPYSAA
ncbi:esterase/lipase family protein [Catenulispora sp. MAP5-51]|uniref:esterase/lipase family protein n=1 Tax=Catenulispora sp. MAP5-51 TaxID=3156298 RepID=UPI0035192EE2